MFDPLRGIDVEDGYRGAGFRRRANERGTIPTEVLCPYMRSRIKKRCHFTGHRIVARNVWPLGRVALGASETQVSLVRFDHGAFAQRCARFRAATQCMSPEAGSIRSDPLLAATLDPAATPSGSARFEKRQTREE